MTAHRSKPEDIWAVIDREKRRDRLVRRISMAAWVVTTLVVLVFAAKVAADTTRAMRMVDVGVAPSSLVWETLMPLVAVVGTISLLVAVLATVGVFLRLRTASLHEIQLRLTTLEEMLADRSSDATTWRAPDARWTAASGRRVDHVSDTDMT